MDHQIIKRFYLTLIFVIIIIYKMRKINIYHSYRYLLIVLLGQSKGQKGVGKTNLLTRFLMDEFVDNPNFIFQGEQRVILTLKEKVFEVILEDRYNFQDLKSLPPEVLGKTNGIMFVFSFEVQNSFQVVQTQINFLQKIVEQQPYLSQLATILVGNKNENGIPQLEMGDDSGRLSFMDRASLNDRARTLCRNMEIKYFQVSTKYSEKQQIEQLFIELINENELKSFKSIKKKKKQGLLGKIFPSAPCCGQENCLIY